MSAAGDEYFHVGAYSHLSQHFGHIHPAPFIELGSIEFQAAYHLDTVWPATQLPQSFRIGLVLCPHSVERPKQSAEQKSEAPVTRKGSLRKTRVDQKHSHAHVVRCPDAVQ